MNLHDIPPVQRLLLIDDDADFRWTLHEALLEFGPPCRLHEATTAEQAETMLFREGPGGEWVFPDAILLDLELPGMDGLEFLGHIRTAPMLQDLPVVVLTGLEDPSLSDRARQAGAVGYVLKTGSLREMVEKISELLWHSPTPAMHVTAAPRRRTSA